jgi:DNA-binding response OmpR family regulator
VAKVLLLEDDVEFAEDIKTVLLESLHRVDHCETIASAKYMLSLNPYELLVLDWELPDGHGTDLMRSYRLNGGTAPILMLTARNTMQSKLEGLNTGSDDYLTKPCDIDEFEARVRALLRRYVGAHSNHLRVGSLTVDVSEKSIAVDGQPVTLSPNEYRILEFLASHKNQFFSSEDILNNVWDTVSESSPDTVKATIFRLRKRLEGYGASSLIIQKKGFGYSINADS